MRLFFKNTVLILSHQKSNFVQKFFDKPLIFLQIVFKNVEFNFARKFNFWTKIEIWNSVLYN